MKTLYFIRHAKSDWTHDLPDFDRPLSERGHTDAPKMAKYLMDNGFTIDHFVSSPAKRALTTCRYFAETFGNSKIQKVEDLYEPLLEDFENTIMRLSDDCASVALFSHNPTISQYASHITGESVEFPTCGVAVIEADTDSWSNFGDAEKKLIQFFKPKEI